MWNASKYNKDTQANGSNEMHEQEMQLKDDNGKQTDVNNEMHAHEFQITDIDAHD